jgi:hypothetical protein
MNLRALAQRLLGTHELAPAIYGTPAQFVESTTAFSANRREICD